MEHRDFEKTTLLADVPTIPVPLESGPKKDTSASKTLLVIILILLGIALWLR